MDSLRLLLDRLVQESRGACGWDRKWLQWVVSTAFRFGVSYATTKMVTAAVAAPSLIPFGLTPP